MPDTSSQTGSATAGTGPQTGFLDPAPGTTEAQHREAEEMERPQADDPGPPPPPPLPPAPPREQGGLGDEEEEIFEHLPLGKEAGELDRGTLLAREISKVVRDVPVPRELGETYGAKPLESVQGAFAESRRHLLDEQKAFRDVLEKETDPARLAELMDAYECFQKAYEYGVGTQHYLQFAAAVSALDYSRIALYVKVFRTLLGFQEID